MVFLMNNVIIKSFHLIFFHIKVIMATGTVKWFNPNKGFGFIQQDNASKDVFVHANELNGVYIKEGDKIEFDIIDAEKGLSAQNIKTL